MRRELPQWKSASAAGCERSQMGEQSALSSPKFSLELIPPRVITLSHGASQRRQQRKGQAVAKNPREAAKNHPSLLRSPTETGTMPIVMKGKAHQFLGFYTENRAGI
jgi:hypothetical protein